MLGDDHSESASTWVAQPRYGGAAASRSQTGTQKSVSGSGTTFDKHKYGHPSSVASHSVSSSPNKAGKASWNQSPSKASSVVDTGRWARPKNPNVSQNQPMVNKTQRLSTLWEKRFQLRSTTLT